VPVEPLTPGAVIELGAALRKLGVRRFEWGDLAFDFEPSLAEELTEAAEGDADTLAPPADNAVSAAALRLANRGRSVA
jgi:hypothetical protein